MLSEGKARSTVIVCSRNRKHNHSYHFLYVCVMGTSCYACGCVGIAPPTSQPLNRATA